MIADINKVVLMQIFQTDYRRDATIARLFQLDSLAKSDGIFKSFETTSQ